MFPAIDVNRGAAANLNFPDAGAADENKRSSRKHNKVMEQLNRALEQEQTTVNVGKIME